MNPHGVSKAGITVWPTWIWLAHGHDGLAGMMLEVATWSMYGATMMDFPGVRRARKSLICPSR